ncbi:MAG TPA: CHAP domain-containing protein [Ktedonobacteraceae bacterium]|nr:CHAP domain-containing protein [Ktedonobacteraceae bacterium]
MKKRILFLVVTLLALVLLQAIAVRPPQAYAAGDPHNCDALAQGATTGRGGSPSPFHAHQIPNAPTFSWGSGASYLVGCQENSQSDPGYQNANWDGYGNPFQCVELIGRYEQMRYGGTYVWQDAYLDWNNHPAHYVQEANGGPNVPVPGDIVVWPITPGVEPSGHIALIIAVNAGAHQVTILEQNWRYDGVNDDAYRVLSYTYNAVEQSASITSHTFYTVYRQDLSSYSKTNSSEPNPLGWLHSTI